MNLNLKAVCLGILTVTLLTGSAHAQAGRSGLAFLKLGISGRAVSMADAMSANIFGAASTFYNPAGLVRSSGDYPTQLMVMHKEWIQDTRSEFLGASLHLDDANALGISLNTTTVSDIEIRERPGPAQGTFTARDFSIGASYAHQLTDNILVGLTAKFLYEKILVDEASGFAFDLGAQYRTPIEHLWLGGSVANLGTMNQFRTEKITLPALLRIGPAYSGTIESITSEITIASDFVYVFPEKKSYPGIGVELAFNHIVAARAGYQFGSEGRGFSAGIGVQQGILALDYGYAPLALDLGNSHTFSLAINL